MDSFEFALLAMRNALSDIWAGFARFMNWAAIGDPDKFYNTPQPDPTRLIYDPHYDWYSGNVHHSDTHIGPFNQDDPPIKVGDEIFSNWITDTSYSYMPGNIYHHD